MARDPVKAKARKQRYRARQHAERYGPGAPNMSGRHGNHARGQKNGRWNPDRMLSSHGYVLVRVGKDHPLAFGNGYAYEHLLVWVAAGRALPFPDELIHHENEDKTDNRLSNLVKKTRSDHGRDHIEERDRDALGRVL